MQSDNKDDIKEIIKVDDEEFVVDLDGDAEDHQHELNMFQTAKKLEIAVIVISSLLLMMFISIIAEIVTEIRAGGIYHTNAWLIEMCRAAIWSGLVILGFGSVKVIDKFFKK